ncbi:exodeoxyribonuclease V subunit alpha [Rhodococcus sp. BP-149]|uniref:exodeoxyribonuclease V subunit alpha n=1 Tax=unclassified Rhodococcus (in: high G+C Gram-positive bacteria) TaxID=192944 RepID=UPI001C9A7A93|nr:MULTISPECIES: exodeoxyribonuclease V subunit alpha [unclassified Rhodococcus (in: high G+C Gram-positive bacteria)]MBY6687345.1 exodeoxyribonuclease V subunit alpha [Rhodococcus sp. BP-288]MBY6694232.1 exodeoxyribonuclease V subunit alpha [Rhodococcus sp. BP-188]MBY6697941.1 exodeoxyribonuclease V subunit alpha [Rhodococcus sp. BP-285]MBY6704161.1 exodeoxyribonuclease V subunit alpha [Rhodococcus sp. BP-283]MBY6712810.1 exodeoxyribonuclease V subunit alpha [Rhodococcus sp. BP-160]
MTAAYPGAVAQRGKGVLRAFNDVGVLTAADVHVALRLGALGGERDELALFAVALAVRAVRVGSVCLDLTRLRDVTADDGVDTDALPWPDDAAVVAALRASPLVLGGESGPLRPVLVVDTADGPLLYLQRYYLQEKVIRDVLAARALDAPAVDVEAVRQGLATYFPSTEVPDRQRIAAALAATGWTTVIAGGPGTGKTHTVARILALLTAVHGPGLRIGLAAPTGKAAARLQESVAEQAPELGLRDDIPAMTVHRLLGWQPGSRSRFRHDAHNRLPYDVVVVDETSMVSSTLMSRLMEAVRADTRLVLVGDPDQLTSVDAGAVLADLVARPVTAALPEVVTALVGADLGSVPAAGDSSEKSLSTGEVRRLAAGTVRLSRGRRFGGVIADLAVAVRDGDEDEVVRLLNSGDPALEFGPRSDVSSLERDVVSTARAVTAAAASGDAAAALAALERHRLLCAHREGPSGVDHWARWAMDRVGADTSTFLDAAQWYLGQPLLVTTNDHDNRIYNGDTGVVVDDGHSGVVAAFARGSTPFLVHPSRLSAVQTVYAMTIHRSQGSQYDTVSVVIPDETSSLLTRELLYTAITRARRTVRIIGSEESVRAGVRRRVLRASGLRRDSPVPFGHS